MMNFTSDQWIILALVFVLGLLIGMFLTAGGRRKWKTRYRDEVTRRQEIERQWDERKAEWDERERRLRDLEPEPGETRPDPVP